MQRVYEIKVTHVEGYYGRRVVAPAIQKVLESLVEEDKEGLSDTAVISVEVRLVQL
jgi:hypothetical protein